MIDQTFTIQQGTIALRIMLRSRLFEEKIDELFQEGLLHGTTHLSHGQEAVQAGVSLALENGDWIVPTHRCHGHTIARGADVSAMFAEMFGSRHGLSKGLGGSMHMADMQHGNPGGSAVVGSSVALAAGIALALKRTGSSGVAVALFGDGASSRGIVHEVMNMASLWKLPLVFLCENNGYGMSAPATSSVSVSSISERASAYNMPFRQVDGNSVGNVHDAIHEATERARRGDGPTLVEAVTYRMTGHSRNDRRLYRTREEEAAWQKKDPICLLRDELYSLGLLDKGEWKDMVAQERLYIEDSASYALSQASDTLDMAGMEALVYPPQNSIEAWQGVELPHASTYREAIREALAAGMDSDPSVFLMGEDIGLYGGCFKVTEGLWERYGASRIVETPVSEEGFTGVAVGAAMMGLRPVVEIMYGDFLTLASDPLVNHAAKASFMSGGTISCPLVVRTPVGSGSGHGSQHTQSLESMLTNIPGLKVVAPATVDDAYVLLASAIADNGPVVFLEHRMLYAMEGDVVSAGKVEALGKAAVRRAGGDITLISYSRALQTCLQAAELLVAEGIDAEVIDLRTLIPLDVETLRQSVRRTGRVLIVHDAPLRGGFGGEIAASLVEDPQTFAALQVPVARLCGKDLPIPFSRPLEESVVPTVEKVMEQVRLMLQ